MGLTLKQFTFIKKTIILASMFTLGSLVFIYAYVPNMIVEIKNPLIDFARSSFYDIKLRPTTQQTQNISFKTHDGLLLNANIYKVNHAKANIILLHGIRSSKEQWNDEANWLNQIGYNAIALDLRAHGQSQGRYCSFGYYERQDISDLIDFLQAQGFKQNFGIWGHSLGGAIALQTLAKDKRIKFGIIESAYADFKNISKDYSRYYLHFESDWLNDFLLEKASEKAGFSLNDVNPIDFCPQISQPVLIIHGTADKKINPANSRQIFTRINSNDKKLILVKGAGHTNIHQTGQKKLLDTIARFLNRQTGIIPRQNNVHSDYNSSI